MRDGFSETDLAGPLYGRLAELGYTVRSEVKDCDIAAVKGDELLIIEVKKTLNLPLLVQAVRRQRLTDIVYVAIPRPSNKGKWWRESRGAQHLLRRLEPHPCVPGPGKAAGGDRVPPPPVCAQEAREIPARRAAGDCQQDRGL